MTARANLYGVSNIAATTGALGIHQSDVIIRAALVRGLEDLRANPWLLQYAFASLAQDDLTSDDYGQAQIDEAVRWFMNTDIPVFMAFKINDGPPPLPCVSIALMSSNEGEATLGDVHYDEREVLDRGNPWPVLAGPLRGVTYATNTGIFQLPASSTFVVSKGQSIVTRDGRQYPILQTYSSNKGMIAKGVVDLDQCTIRGMQPTEQILLESLVFHEQYVLGCHASAEPAHVIYLHTIIMFVLLRYKQRFLEARGFGESTVNSTDVKQNDSFRQLGLAETVYSRYLTLNGKVRNYWPKDIATTISTVLTESKGTSDSNPSADPSVQTVTSIDESWLDSDPLSQFGASKP